MEFLSPAGALIHDKLTLSTRIKLLRQEKHVQMKQSQIRLLLKQVENYLFAFFRKSFENYNTVIVLKFPKLVAA